MIQVGNVGDVGNIEIQDLLFTSVGQLPGLILVSWWASAAVQGSVGMWGIITIFLLKGVLAHIPQIVISE